MYEGKEIIYSNNLSSDQPHTNELVVSVIDFQKGEVVEFQRKCIRAA